MKTNTNTIDRRTINSIAKQSRYGALLKELIEAVCAKSRAMSRLGMTSFRSRAARCRDYANYGARIDAAVRAAKEAGVNWGWRDGVVYFDLPAGQVSFVAEKATGWPDYAAPCDKPEATTERIEAALMNLKQSQP